MIDEEVIVSGDIRHQMGKAPRLKEEFSSIRQVTSDAHIGMPAKGCAQIMEAVKESVKTHKSIDMSFRAEIRAETKDDLGGLLVISCWVLAFKSCHHLSNPMWRFGHTIGVGQQKIVVLRGFSSQSEGQFLRRTHPCAIRHKRHAQTRVIDHVAFYDSACLILRPIVHDNHFVCWPILSQQRLEILREVLTLVMGSNYYRNGRRFCKAVGR